jgi:hypothetical protein
MRSVWGDGPTLRRVWTVALSEASSARMELSEVSSARMEPSEVSSTRMVIIALASCVTCAAAAAAAAEAAAAAASGRYSCGGALSVCAGTVDEVGGLYADGGPTDGAAALGAAATDPAA